MFGIGHHIDAAEFVRERLSDENIQIAPDLRDRFETFLTTAAQQQRANTPFHADPTKQAFESARQLVDSILERALDEPLTPAAFDEILAAFSPGLWPFC